MLDRTTNTSSTQTGSSSAIVLRLETALRDINVRLAKSQTFVVAGGNFDSNNGAYDRGAQFLLDGAQAIYPLCFHNPYWGKGQVGRDTKSLIDLGLSGIHFVITDGPAQHNYQAIYGDDPEGKIKGANARQMQNLDARVEEARKLFGPNGTRFSRSDEDFWAKVKSHPAWREEALKIQALWQTSETFRKDVDALTRTSLERHALRDKAANRSLQDGIATPEAIEVARQYTLDELTYVAASPKLLNVPKVLFLYHKDWEPFVNWANGKYDGVAKEQFGFLAIHAASGTYDPSMRVVLSTDEIEDRTSRRGDFGSAGQQVATTDDGSSANGGTAPSSGEVQELRAELQGVKSLLVQIAERFGITAPDVRGAVAGGPRTTSRADL